MPKLQNKNHNRLFTCNGFVITIKTILPFRGTSAFVTHQRLRKLGKDSQKESTLCFEVKAICNAYLQGGTGYCVQLQTKLQSLCTFICYIGWPTSVLGKDYHSTSIIKVAVDARQPWPALAALLETLGTLCALKTFFMKLCICRGLAHIYVNSAVLIELMCLFGH